jgi:hypothetical protein
MKIDGAFGELTGAGAAAAMTGIARSSVDRGQRRPRPSRAPRPVPANALTAAEREDVLRGGARTRRRARRLFCHVYGRSRSKDQFILGWSYSFVAALEPGRTSWTQVLEAVRLGCDDNVTQMTVGGRSGLSTASTWLIRKPGAGRPPPGLRPGVSGVRGGGVRPAAGPDS